MTNMSKDRVEREIVVRASREKVYAALTEPALFPTWGPEKVAGKIAPGERPIFDFGASGKVAVYVVAVEPPDYFAYRWAQGVQDPVVLLADPLQGPNTLVEFRVEAVEGGSRVRVIESGLASLPAPPEVNIDTILENIGKGWELMIGALAGAFDRSSNRVENTVVLAAPITRVYAALSDPMGWWARKIDGKVEPGELPLLDFGPFGKARFYIEDAHPPSYLAIRRGQSSDPAKLLEDPRTVPSTLLEFRLRETADGTRLEQTETGFDALDDPDASLYLRRAQQAWSILLGMLEAHVRS
jgi:uncharacterized protein YndB with AHSA1/START domain